MDETERTNNHSEKEIFLAAIEKATPQERAAYLDGACGKDLLLRQRVEDLLAKHSQQDSFMKDPAGGAVVVVTITGAGAGIVVVD